MYLFVYCTMYSQTASRLYNTHYIWFTYGSICTLTAHSYIDALFHIWLSPATLPIGQSLFTLHAPHTSTRSIAFHLQSLVQFRSVVFHDMYIFDKKFVVFKFIRRFCYFCIIPSRFNKCLPQILIFNFKRF